MLTRLLREFKNADVELIVLCLEIFMSCLRNIPQENTAVQLSSPELIREFMEIINNEQIENRARELVLEILDIVSQFKITHEELANNGLIDYLSHKIDKYVFQKVDQLDFNNSKELVWLLNLCANLTHNNNMNSQIQQAKLLEKILSVYTRNRSISFIRDNIINVLMDMSKSYDGAQTIGNSNINFQDLIHNSIESRNPRIILLVEIIVKNITNVHLIEQILNKIFSGSYTDKDVVYLSYLSSNKKYVSLLENENLLEFIKSLLRKSDISNELLLGLIKIFKELTKVNTKYLDIFIYNSGLDVTSKLINDQSDYFILIELFDFYKEALRCSNGSFATIIKNYNIHINSIQIFTSLFSKYEEFHKNALTLEKAENSIEYHSSEATKAILLNIKNIEAKDIVPLSIALAYAGCEVLTTKLLDFLQSYEDYDLPMEASDDLLLICNQIMKVFKYSKDLHEKIFNFLYKLKFSTTNVEYIVQLNWPFQLCNIIWKKSNWKIFALYVLRFIEAIITDPDSIKILTQGVNMIKLIASIKHFITDEDIRDFEENSNSKSRDLLTYNEEREIYKKCSELLEKLIDTSILQTFQTNITKSIQKFTPRIEVITILRAEYAVLAVVNGINYFGIEGLKNNMHIWLKDNITKIETICKGKVFIHKEFLIADCIRSIANYICITWNENGKMIYESKEISVEVFRLFEQYLKASTQPLYSYVILKAFKEWLVNRIETIERASNPERERIYDKESFMMVPANKRDTLMTDILDALYLTHANFSSIKNVLKLNMEVIMLLSYMYPEWRLRAAKSFIPQIISLIGSSSISHDMDIKLIGLLNQMIGLDETSEVLNIDLLDMAAQNGALDRIFISIANKNFDPRYFEECRPLIERLANNENFTENSYQLVENLIAQLKNIECNRNNIEELRKVIDQINLICNVPNMRHRALEKGIIEVVSNKWSQVSNFNEKNDKTFVKSIKELEQGFITTINQQLHDGLDDNQRKKIYGDPMDHVNPIHVTLKSLQKYRDEPEIVKLCCMILNTCFPSEIEKLLLDFAKQINLKPDIDYIYNSYSDDQDKDFANEVIALYMNLSEYKREMQMEEKLKTVIKDLNMAIAEGNTQACIEELENIQPFIIQKFFDTNFYEYDISGHIARLLKYLHKQVIEKTSKKTTELINEGLYNNNVVDLSTHNKKLLENDKRLAATLMNILNSFSDNIKEKIRTEEDIVLRSDVLVLLNPKPAVLELYIDYLKSDKNHSLLSNIDNIKNGVFVLMKNNKDSFKNYDVEVPNNFGTSGLSTVMKKNELSKSLINNKNQKNSYITTKTLNRSICQEENQSLVLKKNLDLFANVQSILLSKKLIKEIIDNYCNALSIYRPRNRSSLGETLFASRMMIAILKSNKTIDLAPFSEQLKTAFADYLHNIQNHSLNKKLLTFFEQIYGITAKRLEKSDYNLSDNGIWNKLLKIYLVNNPETIKNNCNRVLKNFGLAQPRNINTPKLISYWISQNDGLIKSRINLNNEGPMNSSMLSLVDKIISNLHRTIDQHGISPQIYMSIVEYLSQSIIFCQTLIETPFFDELCSYIVFYENYSDPILFNQLTTILLNIIESIKDEQNLIRIFNKKLHADNILYSYFDHIEFDREDFVITSINACIALFDILDNRSPFYTRNIPSMLLEHLGPLNNWVNRQEAMILLAKMIEDPSLEKLIVDLNVSKFMNLALNKNIASENSIAKNPNQFPLENYHQLAEERNQAYCQMVCYIIGEFSKYDHHALKYVNSSSEYSSPFELYNLFERYDNDPIMAIKLIEATKNAVIKINTQIYNENIKVIKSIVETIPSKITKFKAYTLIYRYLNEIFDYLQHFEDQSIANSFLGRLTKSIICKSDKENQKNDQLKDASGLIGIYNDIVQILSSKTLDKDEIELLNLANKEIINLLNTDTNAIYTFSNMDLPRYLRFIANAQNSSISQKYNALELLNKFAENENVKVRMLRDNYYVIGSSQLIDDILTPITSFYKTEQLILNTLTEDLINLNLLTNNSEGVEYAFNSIRLGIPLIDNLFKILQSDSNNDELKGVTLGILTNLLDYGKEKGLQKKVISELPKLFHANNELISVMLPLTSISGVLASKSDKFKKRMVEHKMPEKLGENLIKFANDPKLQNNTAFAIYELANEFPDSHADILKSKALPILSKAFENIYNSKDLHTYVAKMLLQLSFKNDDRKEELISLNFIKGLVPLFDYYSNINNFDPDICTLLLKSMANFSLIPKGTESLLSNGIIPVFKTFYNNYKSDLPEHIRFMMCTVSNLSFSPQDSTITCIIKDNGIELIVESLAYHTTIRDPETSEICIDALTHVSQHKKSIFYLNNTAAIESLIDLLRQNINDRLCYKALRCLSNFCRDELLSQRLMERGGHKVIVDTISLSRNDLKNVYQAVTLLNYLIDKHQNQKQSFIIFGVPDKVIPVFDASWPDNVAAADTLYNEKGLVLANNIFSKHSTSEAILLDNLSIIENVLQLCTESKNECLNLKMNAKLEQMLMIIDKTKQPRIYEKLCIVLELLKKEDYKIENDLDHPQKKSSSKNTNLLEEKDKEFDNLSVHIPANIQKYIKGGRILRIFGEDGVCRSMHFFVSKDLTDIKCKHPKENYVKQKWIIPIHQIKEIKYGYDKKSPIASSCSIFEKPPSKDKCFIVYGPLEIDGYKNFHCLCANSLEAKKWFDYLTYIVQEYKKILSKNLRRTSIK